VDSSRPGPEIPEGRVTVTRGSADRDDADTHRCAICGEAFDSREEPEKHVRSLG